MGVRSGKGAKNLSRGKSASNLAASSAASRAASAPPPAASLAARLESQKHLWVPLGLVLGLLVVYLQALPYAFLNYDTYDFIENNPHVRAGLSLAGVRWAFTTAYGGYWMPLTWLTHMLDCQLYGLHPWGHHLSSLLLHIADTLLLLAVLRRLTGAFWRSALVAALFAFHPQRVESVVWIAERKDVLSAFFCLLTLLAYTHYARGAFQVRRYLLLVGAFSMAVFSKPSVVTVPGLLLLLDFWPLRRWAPAGAALPGDAPPARPARLAALVLEKVPLLLLAVALSGVTYRSQRAMGFVTELPLIQRLANVPLHYAAYLGKTFWPVSLSVLYPLETRLPSLAALLAALLPLAALSLAALACWRRRPWLVVGWGWFLGALVPMIGLVQVYMASVADRYSYLAQIGLFLCLAWGAAELAQRLSLRRWVVAGLAGAALALLLLLSTLQTPVWHDELTLWNHALKVTRNNYVALMNLSTYWKNRNEPQKALDYAAQAVQVDPANPAYHAQFGNILAEFGQVEAAVDQYREALRLKPGDAAYLGNLGVAYTRLGRGDEALAAFVEALRGNPGDPQNQVNLGSAYAARGDVARAREAFEQALTLDPELFLPHLSLGIFDERAKRFDSARLHLQKAATLAPSDPRPLRQLAQVYAAQGDRVQATKALRSTLTLARAAGNERLAHEIEALLK